MFVRMFFYQPFNIPSGSMKDDAAGRRLPVRLEAVLRLQPPFVPFGGTMLSAYMFDGRMFASQPKRGDVVVFKLPRDNSTDYIKRLIGLPGDEIQMLKGVLYINGKAVPKRRVGDVRHLRGRRGRRAASRFTRRRCPSGVHNITCSMPRRTARPTTPVSTKCRPAITS